jgi:hypothetical protein
MALRGPVRERSVLLEIILNPVARGTQEKSYLTRTSLISDDPSLKARRFLPAQVSVTKNTKRLAARAASRSFSSK